MRMLQRSLLGLFIIIIFGLPTRGMQGADDFPVAGILPKEETGAARFLAEHPEYDGRGVVVAIFDTGVDPGAAGLQVTTDGKPKIVDLVDGSGSGDVDTSTVRKVDDGTIEGLTGRKLKVADDWKCPSGEFHVGIKRAYELFPDHLQPRYKRKRKEKWDAGQRALVTKLEREIAEFDKAHPKPKGDEKKKHEDLKKRLELLNGLGKQYDDPGPIYDCVVFHDGEVWRAAIDTDEDGELADEKLLANYRLERQYATFGDEDLLNFAVNIYNDGNLLSIVADCGEHGTHVAGIVAAHYPNRPELNGIAPSAQIVSVKIGDSRLGSNSTGTGEVRGLIAVLENKCDLINMSYGGPTTDPNRGHNIGLYSEIVNKHGVIWVASAGNNGPALSTVGSPGGTTSAIIGVSAYVSPAMMQAEYSLRKTNPDMPFTWSSRGPTADGDLGVNICAPGAAFAPVPTWALQPNMLMNGTSMSSPNACGGIALLLSGLKAEGVNYTPHSVRRAVENTASPIEGSDVFAYGRGLLQVDKAFEHLKDFTDANGEALRYEVELIQRGGDRGIYLREPKEVTQVVETRVGVRPVFHEDADNREKVAFEMRVALETTDEWIAAPDHLLLNQGGRTFDVEVDPRELPTGVHYGEVRGYDADNRQRGPLFRIPVTVVRPSEVEADERPKWSYKESHKPGEFVRHFITVPSGATWADLTIRAGDFDTERLIVVHAVQMMPKRSYDETEFKTFTRIKPMSETVRSFPVVGGRTLELCAGQYWSTLSDAELEFELTFHGITPSDPELQIDGSRFSERVDVTGTLGKEDVAPKVSLDTLRQSIRPSDATIRPLPGARDLLPDERQIHELLLEYKFDMDESAEVTPRIALLLHDESWGAYQSLLWAVFDQNKRLLATGTDDDTAKLSKGPHVLRYQVRHDSVEPLERLKEMPLLLDRKLSSPLSLGVHSDPDQVIGSGGFSSRTLLPGDRTTIYFSPPKSLPKSARPGDILLGTATYGKPADSESGSEQRPDGWLVRFIVPPPPAAKSDSAIAGGDDSKEDNSLEDELLETKLKRLTSLRSKRDKKQFDKLATAILEEKPNHFPVLIEQLKFIDDEKERKQYLPEIVEAADRVIERIDRKKLAMHYGVRHDPDDEEAAKKNKEMDEQKEILTDALYRKGRALAYMDLPEKYSEPSDKPVKKFPQEEEERDKLFEETFAELQKWVDVTESKYVLLHIRRERRHERFGTALKALNKHIDDSPPKELLFKKRGDIYDELGWYQWRDYERQWMILRFPAAYPPF